MNTKARLKLELSEAQLGILRLRERLSTTPHTAHKDLSLVSLVPKWSGAESAISLEEFFFSIEGSAKIGHSAEADCLQITVLKLTESARTFYFACPELHRETVTWQKFQAIFRELFKDIRTDQFHFTQLQAARQRRNEGPQEFADRCRALAQKLVCKVDDPQAQRIHQENAERMLLTAFVSGLIGTPGRQCRFANLQNIQQALSIALTVDQAEKLDPSKECFYTKCDNTYRESSKTALRCYECQGIGHFAKECPKRQRRRAKMKNSLGKVNPRY